MITQRIHCCSGHLPEKEKDRLRSILHKGAVIAFPTTVYGLAASIVSPKGCEAIYRIKRRPKEKPLILMSDKLEKILPYLQELPPAGENLLKGLPTGAITLILQASNRLPPYLKSSEGTIGFRLAENSVARELMALVEEPLATTSANPSGYSPCLTAQAVEKTLGGQVDLILEWDQAIRGTPSTLVSLSGKEPRILRNGSVSRETIWKILET